MELVVQVPNAKDIGNDTFHLAFFRKFEGEKIIPFTGEIKDAAYPPNPINVMELHRVLVFNAYLNKHPEIKDIPRNLGALIAENYIKVNTQKHIKPFTEIQKACSRKFEHWKSNHESDGFYKLFDGTISKKFIGLDKESDESVIQQKYIFENWKRKGKLSYLKIRYVNVADEDDEVAGSSEDSYNPYKDKSNDILNEGDPVLQKQMEHEPDIVKK